MCEGARTEPLPSQKCHHGAGESCMTAAPMSIRANRVRVGDIARMLPRKALTGRKAQNFGETTLARRLL
jgi:hypothetical protein